MYIVICFISVPCMYMFVSAERLSRGGVTMWRRTGEREEGGKREAVGDIAEAVFLV